MTTEDPTFKTTEDPTFNQKAPEEDEATETTPASVIAKVAAILDLIGNSSCTGEIHRLERRVKRLEGWTGLAVLSLASLNLAQLTPGWGEIVGTGVACFAVGWLVVEQVRWRLSS